MAGSKHFSGRKRVNPSAGSIRVGYNRIPLESATGAAAAVVLAVLPFVRTGIKPEAFTEPAYTEADPDAVMNRVNLHLARTVPAPMEPLMLGLPDMNP